MIRNILFKFALWCMGIHKIGPASIRRKPVSQPFPFVVGGKEYENKTPSFSGPVNFRKRGK